MTVTTSTRRRFIALTPLAGVAVLMACSPKTEAPLAPAPAPAPAPAAVDAASLPMVDEKDTQATTLGYVADATRVDKTKYTNFVDGSQCAGCALYQGLAGDAKGPCTLFAGKAVPAQGWCASWAKKA
jgi:hypothetical protein